MIESTEDPFVRVHDLVLKIFLEQLPNIANSAAWNQPCSTFPARRSTCYGQNRIRFGATGGTWGEWSRDILSGDARHGGMRSIIMEQTNVDDRRAGYIRATVQPSEKFKPGVWMQINDHYQLEDISVIPDGSSKDHGHSSGPI